MVTLRNLTICFVVIFFSHATPSLCRELHFDSTDQYNIRWGKQEGDADLVKCRHGLTVGYSFGPGWIFIWSCLFQERFIHNSQFGFR